MLPRIDPSERTTSSQRIGVALFGLVIFGLFTAEVMSNFEPSKLSVPFVIIAYVLLLAVHEAAHALVARALGWQVCRVVIGFGRPLFEFRVGEVPVEVRVFPAGGFVIPAPRSERGGRWKSALIYFAGPGSELLVVAATALLVGPKLWQASIDPATIAAQSLVVAALVGVFFNLLPLRTRDGITDGLGMIISWFLPESQFRARLGTAYVVRAEQALLAGDLNTARATLSEGLTMYADNLAVILRLSELCIEAGAFDLAIGELEPLLAQDNVPSELQPGILAALSLALLRTDPNRSEDVEDYSRIALEQAPLDAEVVLARAAVLIEQGHYHAALRKLEALSDDSQMTPEIVDARDTYWMLADYRRGNRSAASEQLARLERRGARGELLDHVRREMGAVRQRFVEAPEGA